MSLKRKSARSRLEESVFEYFISRGDRQTLKGTSDGNTEMLRNESSSRFGQITSDGMLRNRLANGINKVPEQMLKEVWMMTGLTMCSQRKMHSGFTDATPKKKT